MLIRIITSLMIGCIAGSSAFSQEKTAAVQIRAVLHDPVHPVADLYIADPSGAIVKLNLLAEGFSRAQFTLPQNGSIVLFDKANVDPTNINKIGIVITPTAANSTSIGADGLRINDEDTFDPIFGIISRSTLATPLTKIKGRPIDVEYILDLSF